MAVFGVYVSKYTDFIKKNSTSDLFSIHELSIWQREASTQSRYGQMKRALAAGDIEKIKRGLYILCHQHRRKMPHLFEIAQYLYGPSYISCESALSFWGLIPERVYTTTNITSKRSNKFQTPLGPFVFLHLPYQPLFLDVHRRREDEHTFFIASPTKALLDYVFIHKIDIKSPTEWLQQSLRIEDLSFFSPKELALFLDYYKSSRIKGFIHQLQKELQK